MSTRFRHPRLLAAALVVAAVGAAAVTVGRTTNLHAADPFVAGGLSTRAITTRADDDRFAQVRGHAVAISLGIASVREVSQRLDDRFDHRTYDEVTSFDAAGRPVAITRLDLDGTVAMTTVLDWQAPGRRAVDETGAIQRAAAVLRRLGLSVLGRPEVRASAGAGGWSVAWPRVEQGVPVRGDGVRVLLFADGTFHGLTRTERPLAPRPDRTISAARARAIAEARLASAGGSSAGDLRVAAVELAWVAPTVGPNGSRLDAPVAVLRLAWGVRFEATGATAGRLRATETWLDAGDGSFVGEDAIA
jgi:hypothetical protein